ncbi:MarR family transcriptional regulator [Lentilactobacillus laojiaonis]|uniref:MarR family transcriptional regulator n=1 Tax=Lentilactobacillus laojiaonis TaxID=2883998 RepID=UPI001D0AE697|nr:MarR family transcriptional regulator [Lentilactobacillus laojiaonis]UDM32566.1 MarR family transcriptional regulator [Lentilactobacillus laojiaonis]
MKEIYVELQNELLRYKNREIDDYTINWYLKNSSEQLKNIIKKLTLNDLDMLDLIHNNPGTRLSDYADFTSIRQGTISKIINKLAKNNLVDKYHQPDNKKTTYVKLLPTGQHLYELHQKYHEEINKNINSKMSQFSEHDLLIVKQFLQAINSID